MAVTAIRRSFLNMQFKLIFFAKLAINNNYKKKHTLREAAKKLIAVPLMPHPPPPSSIMAVGKT